jgi:abhydrolase domain-containing protein 6
MRKFILRLVIIVLVVSGLASSGWLNRVTPASTCEIATRSTKIGSGTLFYNRVGTGIVNSSRFYCCMDYLPRKSSGMA